MPDIAVQSPYRPKNTDYPNLITETAAKQFLEKFLTAFRDTDPERRRVVFLGSGHASMEMYLISRLHEMGYIVPHVVLVDTAYDQSTETSPDLSAIRSILGACGVNQTTFATDLETFFQLEKHAQMCYRTAYVGIHVQFMVQTPDAIRDMPQHYGEVARRNGLRGVLWTLNVPARDPKAAASGLEYKEQRLVDLGTRTFIHRKLVPYTPMSTDNPSRNGGARRTRRSTKRRRSRHTKRRARTSRTRRRKRRSTST